jgi:hypothetical protein
LEPLDVAIIVFTAFLSRGTEKCSKHESLAGLLETVCREQENHFSHLLLAIGGIKPALNLLPLVCSSFLITILFLLAYLTPPIMSIDLVA